MTRRTRLFGAVTALVTASTACSSTGGIGDVLGGVLSPAPANQVEGTISGVDTRAQQIFLRENGDQIIAIAYDDRTQVRYQQQSYGVSALDPGDQVRVRLQQNGSDAYYTDLIEVTEPSAASAGSLVSLQGTVRSVDTARGMFTMTSNGQVITVSLPYNARSVDVNQLRNLRAGQSVRVQGTWLTATRLELYQFM